MSNKLANEPSRYLRQHAHNPVDWRPWGETAFEEAKRAEKPVFLSIGYSSCHWCHVMAHESFEDEETAGLINELFVPIKVDREEFPDVDGYYMSFLSQLAGQGGWPLNVFVNPEKAPFYGITYMQKDRLQQLFRYISDEYGKNSAIRDQTISTTFSQKVLTREQIKELSTGVVIQSPRTDSGPQFPQGLFLSFALGRGHGKLVSREMEYLVLKGLFDHIEGGWFRYSVDPQWKIPHFEKMLYDQAVLLHLCARAYDTNKETCDYAIRKTVSWLVSHMRLPSGFFGSATDADTKDGEGFYYTFEDISTQEEADLFKITECGSHEQRHLPWIDLQKYLSNPEQAEKIINIRRKEREQYQVPELDRKVVFSWNAFLAYSLYLCAAATGDNEIEKLADELFSALRQLRGNATPHAVYEDGETRGNAYLEDYAAYLLLLSEAIERKTASEAEIEQVIDAIEDLFIADGKIWNSTVRKFESQSMWQDSPFPAGGSMLLNALIKLKKKDHALTNYLFSNIAELAYNHQTFFAYWAAGFDRFHQS